MNIAICVLAFIWGAIWAHYLQFNEMGQFLVQKRTWLTVVIGVGVDLLLLLPVIPKWIWFKVFTVIGFSSLAIIFRSLWNELRELLDTVDAIQTKL